MGQPLILLTNDDGINAQGLYSLARAAAGLGEVVIVAPDSERSATGHAITLSEPLRADRVFKDGTFYGYGVNGTPADAVKVGVKALLARPPDLVISGINLGPNTGINVIYSGTVSAATEAAIMGINAIAVSLGTFTDPDYSVAARFAAFLARRLLARPPGERLLLNVNVPAIPEREIRGVKVTHQGTARFDETLEKRADLRGRIYYWLGGELRIGDESETSDSKALQGRAISVTPLHFDMTDYRLLPAVQGLDLDGWRKE